MKVLRDRIAVERLPDETMTASGIIIPDSQKEKPARGHVVMVGIGHLATNGDTTPLQVEVGDEVLFSKYAGTDINVDNKEYLVIREEDIQAVV